MNFASRSADVDAVVDEICDTVGGFIFEGGRYPGTDFALIGGDVNTKGVAPGHRVKLELCQFDKFTKNLFH